MIVVSQAVKKKTPMNTRFTAVKLRTNPKPDRINVPVATALVMSHHSVVINPIRRDR